MLRLYSCTVRRWNKKLVYFKADVLMQKLRKDYKFKRDLYTHQTRNALCTSSAVFSSIATSTM